MKIHNKSNLWVGLVLLVIPNFFPQYQNSYKDAIQAIGFVLVLLSFIKFKKRDKQLPSL